AHRTRPVALADLGDPLLGGGDDARGRGVSGGLGGGPGERHLDGLVERLEAQAGPGGCVDGVAGRVEHGGAAARAAQGLPIVGGSVDDAAHHHRGGLALGGRLHGLARLKIGDGEVDVGGVVARGGQLSHHTAPWLVIRCVSPAPAGPPAPRGPAPPGGAVDARTTRVAGNWATVGSGGDGASGSIAPNSAPTAAAPACAVGAATVVRAGVSMAASGMSSKPTTLRSSGTATPRRARRLR